MANVLTFGAVNLAQPRWDLASANPVAIRERRRHHEVATDDGFRVYARPRNANLVVVRLAYHAVAETSYTTVRNWVESLFSLDSDAPPGSLQVGPLNFGTYVLTDIQLTMGDYIVQEPSSPRVGGPAGITWHVELTFKEERSSNAPAALGTS